MHTNSKYIIPMYSAETMDFDTRNAIGEQKMIEKLRAGRNQTIFLDDEATIAYSKRCIGNENISGIDSIVNKIICADSFEAIKLLPDKFVDLLIVDPPYNLDKTYGEKKFRKMDISNYEVYTRKWIEGVIHTLKDTATVYVCCDWKTSLIIGRLLSDYFLVRNRITWQREKGRGALTNWKNAMEDIWFATVSDKYTFNVEAVKQRRKVIAPYRKNGKPKDWEETENGNYRNTYPSNFWNDISIPYWSMPENTDHPTQKPEKLIAKLLLASSNDGEIILDPFLGSGTTSVVAKKLNRRYVGIERETEYCALAEKRLEIAEKDTSIQGYSGGIFWDRNSLAEQKRHLKQRAGR